MSIYAAVLRLHQWFETMRAPQGYTGPVVHWWESSLVYTGVLLDWRYEGILCGYVTLFRRTGQSYWLETAITAADALIAGQLENGCFWNSSFQIGALEGGTPHEAAADVGLLELAIVLKEQSDRRWEIYYLAAQRNLLSYHIGKLWDGRAFCDQSTNNTHVANKNSTVLDALLLYQNLSNEPIKKYVKAIVELIYSAQVMDATMPHYGGIVHLGTGHHRLVIGIYTARSLSALCRLHETLPRWVDVARLQLMGQFLYTLLQPKGTAFGYYPTGDKIQAPLWVSPSGDLLRAFIGLRKIDVNPLWDDAIQRLTTLITANQMASGGIPTAYGLHRKGQLTPVTTLPDFRDVLPVVGWCDKAFRALALLVKPTNALLRDVVLNPTTLACHWAGIDCVYQETADKILLRIQHNSKFIYSWDKKSPAPTVYGL